MVGPERPLFVLFGSSIVQYSFAKGGWGATLADLYARKADILLRGYTGWNSSRALEVLDKVFPKDSIKQPSLIIVYFGGNDSVKPHPSGLGPHVPLEEYIENMRKILTYLKELSESVRLIVLTSPPVNEDMISFASVFAEIIRTNEACQQYSEACVQLCNNMNIKVIDLYSAIQEAPDWRTSCFTTNVFSKENLVKVIVVKHSWKAWRFVDNEVSSNDGIHLTSRGSDIVVTEILKVLKNAEWEPCLHWKSLPSEFSEDLPCYPVACDNKSTINLSEYTGSILEWN